MSRRFDIFKFIIPLALAIGFLILAYALGRGPLSLILPTANAQTAPLRVTLPTVLEGMDRMTYVVPLNEGHPLCWSNGNFETNLTIRFYRYRVEGGPKQLYLDLPFNLWVAQPVATNYCTAGTHKVPKAGHWIYEAEICFTPVAPDRSNCSLLVSAACAACAACTAGTDKCAGAVGSVSRGWWIYGYLPAPSGPVVN